MSRLAVVVALVAVLSGCGGLPGHSSEWSYSRTVVDNLSARGYVAQIDDYTATQQGFAFVPIEPLGRTVIDTQGEMNSSTTHVWIWDRDCETTVEVVGSFAEGGIVTISEIGDMTFAAGYSGQEAPIELDTATPSCAEAATALN